MRRESNARCSPGLLANRRSSWLQRHKGSRSKGSVPRRQCRGQAGDRRHRPGRNGNGPA
jgi:hypothetical protein